MRVNEMQLYSAMNEFIDREMKPCGATMDNKEQFLFNVKIGIIRRKIQHLVKSFLARKDVKMLQLVDENGYIDVETLYQAVSDTFLEMKQIELAGFTFREENLQKLYGIMQQYANQSYSA